MNSSHTPGPWSYYLNPLTGKSAIAPSGDWPPLAKVNTESDARLIAAAPELLAALQAIVNGRVRISDKANDMLSEHDPKVISARAAIAKARGN